MTIDLLKYAWRFALLCLLQVLVFNNLQLGGLINAFPYIYFILILPISLGRIPLLFLGFALGLTIDVFSDTGGMHAAASTLIAFYRPLFLQAQSPREGYELHAVPHIRVFGVWWFLLYATLLVLIHHFALFFIEVFRFSEFFYTLFKVLLSTIVTLVLILLIEFLFAGNSNR